jgi:hypothetical protein
MLDHRLSGDVGERLAGKPRGSVAGWDDGDDSGWSVRFLEGIWECALGHEAS